MTDDEAAAGEEKLFDLITTITGGYVNAFAVVAEYIDNNGDIRIYTATLPDQRAHRTLGLLAWADTKERHAITLEADGDD